MSLLGLDVGISGCRALAVSVDGALLADAGRGYPSSGDPMGCDLEARGIWQAVSAVLQEVAAKTADDPIVALAVSSVGNAIVPLGRDGTVLASCLIGADPSEQDVLAGLMAHLSADAFNDMTGRLPQLSSVLSRLNWLCHNQPALYATTWRFALMGGLVAHLLGANTTCDYSLASGTLCFDRRQRAWSREILEACELSPLKMPVIGQAAAPIGVVSSRVARDLGVSPRMAIVLGGHDLACHALGVGAVRGGMAVLNLGTGVHMTSVHGAVPAAAEMVRAGLVLEYHVAPGLTLIDDYMQAGGAWLRWFANEIIPLEQREATRHGISLYRLLLNEMPRQPSPLLVVPPGDTAGSRGGSIHGLTLETPRGALIKGMLEGIALRHAHVQERLEAKGVHLDAFRVTGGGARTDAWAELCADVLAQPVERTTTQHSAALGAAILAGVGIGAYDDVAEGVRANVHVERVFEPDPQRQRVYAERLKAYQALLDGQED